MRNAAASGSGENSLRSTPRLLQRRPSDAPPTAGRKSWEPGTGVVLILKGGRRHQGPCAAASCPKSPLLGREVGGCRARGEAALAGADARDAVAGAAAGFAQPGPCCRGAARHARRMAEASSAVAHYCWCQTEGEVPRRSRGLSAASNNASRRYFEKTCALSMSLFCKGRQVSRRGWSAMFIISLFFEELELDVPAPSPCSLQRGSTSIWIFPSKLRAHPAFSSFRFGWLSG